MPVDFAETLLPLSYQQVDSLTCPDLPLSSRNLTTVATKVFPIWTVYPGLPSWKFHKYTCNPLKMQPVCVNTVLFFDFLVLNYHSIVLRGETNFQLKRKEKMQLLLGFCWNSNSYVCQQAHLGKPSRNFRYHWFHWTIPSIWLVFYCASLALNVIHCVPIR